MAQTPPVDNADELADLLRRSEQRIQETERKYQEVTDSLSDTVFEMDVEGRITFVNRSAFDRWGYTLEEFERGITAFHLIAPEDRDLARQNAARVFAGEQPRSEYRGLRKDGTRFWMSIASTRVVKEGRLIGLRGLAVDITDHKRAEESIRRSEERYRSLVQNAVFGIYRTDADGRFVEANAALAAMLGYDNEGALIGRDILPFYQDPAERGRLLGQYAGTDRIQGVEVQWKRRDGSSIMVRLTGRPVRADDGTAGFEMIVEDVSERWELEQQFRQAQKMEAIGRLAGGIAHDFNNLLTAMGGYSDLLIDQFAADDPRRQDLLEIKKAADRAGALTRQLLAFSRKQILQPKAVDLSAVLAGVDTLVRRLIGKGTGLGLATVYGIVRQSGGHIYVDSEPDQGSTFEVYFPRLDKEVGGTRARSLPVASRTGTETVLLAEDEDAVRNLTRDVLSRQGYRVLEARTGGEALSVSTRFPERIDLLLTDVVMPEMGGRELARRLVMQRPYLRVVYVSGHTDDMVMRTRELEPGMAFLPKPYTPESLATTVRETLDEARVR